MQTTGLSDDAATLLRRRLAGEWVEVTEETLPRYRELVEAGLMIPLHSFVRGAEGAFRLTELAVRLRDSAAPGQASPLPSSSIAPAPRG